MRLFYWLLIGWWYEPIKAVFKMMGALTTGVFKVSMYIIVIGVALMLILAAFSVAAPILLVVCAIWLIASIVLYFVKKARGDELTAYGNINIDAMNGYDFERFCADVLRTKEFTNVDVTKSSGDQGVDVIAMKNGIRYAIQCKRYSQNVGNRAVQEVLAGKEYYDCSVGIVMTNSYFTKSAIDLAEKTGIILWDRNYLLNCMRSVNQQDNRKKELEEKGKKLLQDVADIYTSLFQDKMHVNVVLVESRFKEHSNIELIYRCDTNEQAKYLVSQQYFLSERLQSEQNFTELSDNCISVLIKSD